MDAPYLKFPGISDNIWLLHMRRCCLRSPDWYQAKSRRARQLIFSDPGRCEAHPIRIWKNYFLPGGIPICYGPNSQTWPISDLKLLLKVPDLAGQEVIFFEHETRTLMLPRTGFKSPRLAGLGPQSSQQSAHIGQFIETGILPGMPWFFYIPAY